LSEALGPLNRPPRTRWAAAAASTAETGGMASVREDRKGRGRFPISSSIRSVWVDDPIPPRSSLPRWTEADPTACRRASTQTSLPGPPALRAALSNSSSARPHSPAAAYHPSISRWMRLSWRFPARGSLTGYDQQLNHSGANGARPSLPPQKTTIPFKPLVGLAAVRFTAGSARPMQEPIQAYWRDQPWSK